ncbi:N-acetyl-gamma-glutamyl-phosphate reductase, partial [Lysobacter sp. 2RAB21]
YFTSRELFAHPLADHNPEYAAKNSDLRYSSPSHEELPGLGADAVVLALPNGKAADCVAAFDAVGAEPVIIDLSADYR